MPSSKDPAINRQKARDYRLAHPDWHRRSNREWMRKKRAGLGKEGRQELHLKWKQADPIGYLLVHARDRAKSKGLPFDLSREDLTMPAVCPVFGERFEWGRGHMGWRNRWAPSLDRV